MTSDSASLFRYDAVKRLIAQARSSLGEDSGQEELEQSALAENGFGAQATQEDVTDVDSELRHAEERHCELHTSAEDHSDEGKSEHPTVEEDDSEEKHCEPQTPEEVDSIEEKSEPRVDEDITEGEESELQTDEREDAEDGESKLKIAEEDGAEDGAEAEESQLNLAEGNGAEDEESELKLAEEDGAEDEESEEDDARGPNVAPRFAEDEAEPQNATEGDVEGVKRSQIDAEAVDATSNHSATVQTDSQHTVLQACERPASQQHDVKLVQLEQPSSGVTALEPVIANTNGEGSMAGPSGKWTLLSVGLS